MKKVLVIWFLLMSNYSYSQNSIITFGFSYLTKPKTEDRSVEILEIVNRSEAQRAGLLSGDEITGIDSYIIKDLSSDEIDRYIMTAKEKGQITLKINRLVNPVLLKTSEVVIYECLSGDCNNGKGKLRNNRTFQDQEGNFKDGRLNDHAGIITYFGKTKRSSNTLIKKQVGDFVQGTFISGKTYFSNGDLFAGSLKNGYPYGPGIYTDQYGVIYEGDFGNYGKLMDGVIKVKDATGKLTEQRYKNGEFVKIPEKNDTKAAPKKQTLLFGFINNKGKLVLPFKYKKVSDFNEGVALAHTINDELVIIDRKGKETAVQNKSLLAGFLLEGASVFNDGLCAVSIDNKFGFINLNGELIIPCEYTKPILPKNSDWQMVSGAPKFASGVAVIHKNGLYGAINMKGNIVVPIEYQYLTHFKHKLAIFQKDLTKINTRGVLNTNGEIIAKPRNKNVWIDDANTIRYHFVDGSYSNFYGYYNSKGEENADNRFEYLSAFENGFALYGTKKETNFWGIVNAEGKRIGLKEKYKFDKNAIEQFKGGYLYPVTGPNNKVVVLNNKGERLNNDCEYNYIYRIREGIAFANKEKNKISYYNNLTCSVIYETDLEGGASNYMFSIFSGVYEFNGGYAAIKQSKPDSISKQHRFIIIDKTGKITFGISGNRDCSLRPCDKEPGLFTYAELYVLDFKKPSYKTYLKGDGTILYKGLSGSRDYNDGLAAVMNMVE